MRGAFDAEAAAGVESTVVCCWGGEGAKPGETCCGDMACTTAGEAEPEADVAAGEAGEAAAGEAAAGTGVGVRFVCGVKLICGSSEP